MRTGERVNELRIVNRPADRKRGLTLAELGAFLQECHRAGIPLEGPVEVAVGWRGQVQRIEITAVEDAGG